MRENGSEGLLVPVWHLGRIISDGFEEVCFSAQTGEEVQWTGNKYILPELFGWEKAKKQTNLRGRKSVLFLSPLCGTRNPTLLEE